MTKRKFAKIVIWPGTSRVPARTYGDAHFGRGQYRIYESADPSIRTDLAAEPPIVRYHFSGNSSGRSRARY